MRSRHRCGGPWGDLLPTPQTLPLSGSDRLGTSTRTCLDCVLSPMASQAQTPWPAVWVLQCVHLQAELKVLQEAEELLSPSVRPVSHDFLKDIPHAF